MECSICYREISATTGKVELSCSHPFHFSCLAKWFGTQKLDGSCESCPLCRHDTTEFEKMPDTLKDDGEDTEAEELEEEQQQHEQEQQGQHENETREQAIDRMQRESVAVGNAFTGPEGIWRKTRYGVWVMVSRGN